MRLYTFVHDGRERVGAEMDGKLVDLLAAQATRDERSADASGWASSMFGLIGAGKAGLETAREVLAWTRHDPAGGAEPGLVYGFDEVTLGAPLPRPGKILCSGINYRGHLEENPGATLPETPGFFAKLPSAVIGPGQPIIHPRLTEQLDYEVELAVVIGQRMRHAPEHAVMDGIMGYTILHDVLARDVQFKAPQPNQITLGKNFDTFAPMGPCIVTTDEIPDPSRLGLHTYVDGELLQDGSNADWVFPLPCLIAFLSQVMTLEPGDIVTTGTPAGVGVFRRPQRFLKPGDRVALEIDGIGRLENPVVAEA